MCSEDIHIELFENEDQIICPFCDKIYLIVKFIKKVKHTKCCSNMNVIKTIDCERVCNRCGQTYPYDYAKPFIDFYENRNLYHKKSYYIRKYHIENVIWKLKSQNNFDISYVIMEKISNFGSS